MDTFAHMRKFASRSFSPHSPPVLLVSKISRLEAELQDFGGRPESPGFRNHLEQRGLNADVLQKASYSHTGSVALVEACLNHFQV